MLNSREFDKISDLLVKEVIGIITLVEKQKLNYYCSKYHLKGQNGLDKTKVLDKLLLNRDLSNESKVAYDKFILETNKTERTSTQYSFRFKPWNYAAAILLLITITSLTFLLIYPSYNHDKKILSNLYYNNIIEPSLIDEHNKVIMLSNGIRLPLNKDNDSISEIFGISVLTERNKTSYIDDLSLFKFPFTNNNAWNTLLVPHTNQHTVILSDGSEIIINSQSSIKYPISITNNKRIVYISGEAYFKVKCSKDKPFVVKTSMGDVSVLGTNFNIRDYPDENSVIITLEEGVVKYSPTNSQKESITLVPGFQVVDTQNSKELKLTAVNTSLFTSWKDGNYIFENTPLEEIMKILGKWYNVTFTYDSQEIKQIRYTGIIKRYPNISKALDFLESCEDVSFQLLGKTVIIKKARS